MEYLSPKPNISQGLDTPTPYMQLQGTIFKGRHDLLLGTEMIFTDDKGASRSRLKLCFHHS